MILCMKNNYLLMILIPILFLSSCENGRQKVELLPADADPPTGGPPPSNGSNPGEPVLFFSDLDSGPKTGWEGSSTKGAAVTLWGMNLGTSRGSSYVTVAGVNLTNSSDYAEWGTTGTSNGVARGLQRITFWLNSSCADGASTISVTVNGVTSNTVPFTVRSGVIKFIAISDGSDAYNGNYSTRTGHTGSDGPYKSPYMAMTHQNSTITPGTTIYFRGGTYTSSNVTLDIDSAFMRGRNDTGTAGNPIAFVGYPAEIPVMNCTGVQRGFFSFESSPGVYSGTNMADYLTVSKIKVTHAGGAMEAWGTGDRFIGNWFQLNDQNQWTGVIFVDVSTNTKIYGNYFDSDGYDQYKHDIYIKGHTGDTQKNGLTNANNVYVAWNEFYNYIAPRGGVIDMDQDSSSTNDSYIYIHDNYFHDCATEFLYVHSCDYCNFYNNIFVNGSGGNTAVNTADVNLGFLFYNNTFYNATVGTNPMFYMTHFQDNSTLYSKNNIYYVNSGQSIATVEGGDAFSSDYDLFYGNGSPSCSNCTFSNSVVGDPLLWVVDDCRGCGRGGGGGRPGVPAPGGESEVEAV